MIMEMEMGSGDSSGRLIEGLRLSIRFVSREAAPAKPEATQHVSFKKRLSARLHAHRKGQSPKCRPTVEELPKSPGTNGMSSVNDADKAVSQNAL
jgi:hypothetical protein